MQNNFMTPEQKPLRVGVRKAAELMGVQEPSLRQLLRRQPASLPIHRDEDNRIVLNIDDVTSYFAKKRRIPLFVAARVPGTKFIDLYKAGAILMMPTHKVIKMIQRQELEGYVTSDNQILVSEAAVNRYATGEASHDNTDEL